MLLTGARPLKRVIQKYLINPLSKELLAGNFDDGDTIKVDVAERVWADIQKITVTLSLSKCDDNKLYQTRRKISSAVFLFLHKQKIFVGLKNDKVTSRNGKGFK